MNVFTVDVEEWFHICGAGARLDRSNWAALPSRVVPTLGRVLDLLDATAVPATCFVVGWIAERYPALVADIRAAGHEVGSHSHWHRKVYELTPAEFAADLATSNEALVAAGAPSPRAFRAPEWSIDDRAPWALETLAASGFTVDASMAPVRLVGRVDHPRQPHVRDTSRGAIVEVPPFVADRYGQAVPMGWGWALRMSSPSRVLHAIARVNRLGQPAVLTIHPWELDPDPPRVSLPPRLRFAHYFRLSGFEARLKEIMRHAPFTTLAAAAASVRAT
jgi:polysaccharide deacetylase family protein (PEP-CTERM system associated)